MENKIYPTPFLPGLARVTSFSAPEIKTADPDIIIFDNEDVPIEYMTDLIFENIGGQELLSIARNDTINGQSVIYQPIRNLTSIQRQYNPNNIISLLQTSDKYFAGFSIDISNTIPEVSNRGFGFWSRPPRSHVYIQPTTGNLIIESINLDVDQLVEVEFVDDGTMYNINPTSINFGYGTGLVIS